MTTPNEHERRRLAEIEAALRASDPGLDRALRLFRPRRRWLTACLAAAWMAGAGIGMTRWWIVALVMVGPLLAFTLIVLRPRRRAAPAVSRDGLRPPTRRPDLTSD